MPMRTRSPARLRRNPLSGFGSNYVSPLVLKDCIKLVVYLFFLWLWPRRFTKFRTFSLGLHVPPHMLLAMPEWQNKRFRVINKNIVRSYGVENADEKHSLMEIMADDKFYMQHGVRPEVVPENNPLHKLVQRNHISAKIVFWLLTRAFNVKTASVWINGNGDAITRTHFDDDHSFIFMLHGHSVVSTAPNSKLSGEIRPNESTRTPHNSDVFDTHTMSCGQVAIIPRYTWHYIESVSKIQISYFAS